MTIQEAIDILRDDIRDCIDIGGLDEEIIADNMAIDALRSKSEAEEYRTPKRVIKIMDTNRTGIEQLCYDCPACHWSVQFMGTPISYCVNCGQAIEWADEE